MCGYCIEGGIVIPVLESAYKGEIARLDVTDNFEDFFYILSRLQEEDDFYIPVDEVKKFDDIYKFKDIAVCRLYEQYILHGWDDDFYKKIIAVFGHDVMDVFLQKTRMQDNNQKTSKIWERLCDKETYQNFEKWNHFISAEIELINFSSELLSFYYNWWIKGNEKEISDPGERLIKTGIMDTIVDTSQEEWEKLHALFPWVYFSLMYLWKHDGHSELIGKIALHCSNHTPCFEGYDLWLQRRAFVFYIQRVGIINVLTQHVDEIRLELIYYAVLKCKATRDEAKIIIGLLRENQDNFTFGADVEYYISKIEKSGDTILVRPGKVV